MVAVTDMFLLSFNFVAWKATEYSAFKQLYQVTQEWCQFRPSLVFMHMYMNIWLGGRIGDQRQSKKPVEDLMAELR